MNADQKQYDIGYADGHQEGERVGYVNGLNDGRRDALAGVRAAIAIGAVIITAGDCAETRVDPYYADHLEGEIATSWHLCGRVWDEREDPHDGLTPEEAELP